MTPLPQLLTVMYIGLAAPKITSYPDFKISPNTGVFVFSKYSVTGNHNLTFLIFFFKYLRLGE